MATHHPVCIITGATRGIGRAIAEGLAGRGARVVLACRDLDSGSQVASEIAGRHGSRVDLLGVDLSRPASVRVAMAEALVRFPRIDVVVNNAAAWSTRRIETPDGVERTWATNVLGYFAVMDTLGAGIVRRGHGARIVNVASGLAHSLDLDDVEFRRRRYRGIEAYAQSKQCNRMLTRAFARRFLGTGVTVNSVHPGFTRTRAFRDGGGLQGRIAGLGATLFGQPPERAARTAIWLATSADVEGFSGGYFQDRRELQCSFADVDREEALWDLCARMTRAPQQKTQELACAS